MIASIIEGFRAPKNIFREKRENKMKNSKIKKTIMAMCLTFALAGSMVCFAGCSDKEERSDKEETKVEETTTEETSEETTEETTEATTEETEVSEEEDQKSGKDREPTESEIEEMVGQFDEALQPYARLCVDEGIGVFQVTSDYVDEDLDPEIKEAFVDGFIGMGGSLNVSASAEIDNETGEVSSEGDAEGSDFKMKAAFLFNDYDAAEKFFDSLLDDPDTVTETSVVEKEDTADGKIITITDEGSFTKITLTEDCIILLDMTIKG